MVNHSTCADIEIKIAWSSERATHLERLYYQNITFSYDSFPDMLRNKLIDAPDGEWVTEIMAADDIVPAYKKTNIIVVPTGSIQPVGPTRIRITPVRGRFYPRRIIAGTAGISEKDRMPLRVLSVNDEDFTVDLNHPLAGHQIEVSARIHDRVNVDSNSGAEPRKNIVYEALMSGIGLQMPIDSGTDFYANGAFKRIDETDDARFYEMDRLVNHIDSTASAVIAEFYSKSLEPGMQILDLMSSWQSHLPKDIDKLDVTGLGMNSNEMSANPRLTHHVIHDLNMNGHLPFEDNSFDATTCSLSIEYLTAPLSIMREMVRVTRPGGKLLVSFSDRWFPPKAIAIWQELHSFERLGMALDFFLKTDGLCNLATETVQGLPRPEDDKYADRMLFSDPVFMISASVTG